MTTVEELVILFMFEEVVQDQGVQNFFKEKSRDSLMEIPWGFLETVARKLNPSSNLAEEDFFWKAYMEHKEWIILMEALTIIEQVSVEGISVEDFL